MNLLFNGFIHLGLILIIALVTLGTAISFVVRPGERKLSILRTLSSATLFFVAGNAFAGVGATMLHAAEINAAAGEPTRTIAAGLAEATVPAILGFTFLGLSWLLVAVGLRRQL
jgi:hypothetical protein